MTHLDLFSGIGGFALGFQREGFKTIGFCEIEPYAQKILCQNFNAVISDTECANGRQRKKPAGSRSQAACDRPILWPNIFTLNGAHYKGVDVITGGFPCQPFSVAGKRRGSEDDRHLWPEMLRIISEARPAWVVAENVAGFCSMVEFDSSPEMEGEAIARGALGDIDRRTGRGMLDKAVESLETLGYDVQPCIIPACAVGAFHRRDRIWIIANRNSIGREEQRRSRPAESPDDSAQCLCQDVSDANGDDRNGHTSNVQMGRSGSAQKAKGNDAAGYEWLNEPGMGRVVHGVSNRSHRIKGLGNAIVPQIAQIIARAIIHATNN